MINDRQKNDKIWTHYQGKREGCFDAAYPRLEYLAKRCSPGAIVLNVGAGSGYLESVLNQRGAIKSLLENCGFEVEQLQVRAFPDFSRSGIKSFLKAVFRYILGRMGESIVGLNIYFVCRPK